MANMEETEREELFERMNKYERSRIINLAEKHCAQMMDLIHRYLVLPNSGLSISSLVYVCGTGIYLDIYCKNTRKFY